MSNSIENWSVECCMGCSIELLKFLGDEGEELYQSSVTYHLEEDDSGKTTKAISIITNIIGDCKVCVSRQTAESVNEIYDLYSHVLVMDDEGGVIDEFDLNDESLKCKNVPVEEEFSLVDLATAEPNKPILLN